MRTSKRALFTAVKLFSTIFFLFAFIYTTMIGYSDRNLGARKLIFLKNHKCASTTIENIVHRFAYKNQLNVVIPPFGGYLSRKTLFDRSALEEAPWKNLSFDAFSLHCRWNHKEVVALIGEGTPTFTIIRDPVEVFISFFYFFTPLQDLYECENIHEVVSLVRNASQYAETLNSRVIGQFGRNQMAWDMGIDPKDFENKTAINEIIKNLDKQFDLVMIASRMEESLVLLRLLLDWPLESVQSLARNKRPRDKKSDDKITPEEREILLEWLDADAMIFNFFSKKFDDKITKVNIQYSHIVPPGTTFVENEAAKLRELNRKLEERCVRGETIGTVDENSPYQELENAVGYIVNEEFEDCPTYAWNQKTYVKKFKDILMSRLEKA